MENIQCFANASNLELIEKFMRLNVIKSAVMCLQGDKYIRDVYYHQRVSVSEAFVVKVIAIRLV